MARFSPVDTSLINSAITQSKSCMAIINSTECWSHWLGISTPHHDNAIRTRNRPLAPPCLRGVQSAPLGAMRVRGQQLEASHSRQAGWINVHQARHSAPNSDSLSLGVILSRLRHFIHHATSSGLYFVGSFYNNISFRFHASEILAVTYSFRLTTLLKHQPPRDETLPIFIWQNRTKINCWVLQPSWKRWRITRKWQCDARRNAWSQGTVVLDNTIHHRWSIACHTTTTLGNHQRRLIIVRCTTTLALVICREVWIDGCIQCGWCSEVGRDRSWWYRCDDSGLRAVKGCERLSGSHGNICVWRQERDWGLVSGLNNRCGGGWNIGVRWRERDKALPVHICVWGLAAWSDGNGKFDCLRNPQFGVWQSRWGDPGIVLGELVMCSNLFNFYTFPRIRWTTSRVASRGWLD